jgi:uncharacterized protein (DUF433 family)
MIEISERIAVDPSVRFGRPVVRGTRVPIDVVLGKLASGMDVPSVAEEYGLAREDVLAVLAYAAREIAGEEIRMVG